MRRTNRAYNDYAGNKGEDIVRRYLDGKGCRILEANYRKAFGEIDLIADDGGCVVFIEVKYRKTLAFGTPGEAVDSRKQAKIRKVAACYLAERELNDVDVRFDVLEIYGCDAMRVEHIENAF